MRKSSTQSLKQSLAATFIVVIAALTATLATRHLAFLANLENVAADIRVAAFQPPMPQSKEIVVIAINEDTLSPCRSGVFGFITGSARRQRCQGNRS
jgi:CHASE2 domain-containing sensor protein